MQTELERPSANPATRDAATRYLERTGNGDLLAMLGLVDEPSTVAGRQVCPNCGKPLPDPIANGGFKPCRRRACVAAAAEEAGAR